jgi:cytochrome c oxidase subunit IV
VDLARRIGGVALAVLGVGLVADWERLTVHWPWALPPLSAHVLGAWLCTFAASFLWFGLREREWSRVRVGIVPAMITVALDLVAAARLSGGFHGGGSTAIYLVALTVLFVLLAASALVERRRESRARQPN